MSQTSYVFNKPFRNTTTTLTCVAHPGEPPLWIPYYTYTPDSFESTSYQSEWKALYVGVSTKTPRPWPNGKPGLKQWNSYSWTRKVYITSNGSASTSVVGNPVGGQQRVKALHGSYNHCFQGEPYPTLTLDPNVKLAGQRLLAKIKAMEWNAGESLGEVAQTAGLVVNTMNRIANAILAVKRGKVTRAMEILNVRAKQALGPAQRRAINRKYRTQRERQIASDWLAINYGVLPLIDDVQSAVKHLQSRSDWPLQTQASANESGDKSLTSVTYAGLLAGKHTYISSVRIDTRAKYIVQYSVNGPSIAYFRSLGLTNMPSLAWELTPGSLIVDWFLPIGSWLSNMDATFGCTFTRGVLVQRKTTRFEVNAWLTGTPQNASSGAGSKVWFVESYERTRLTAFPTNFFPSFKNPVSAKHCANALAFLVQAVHR